MQIKKTMFWLLLLLMFTLPLTEAFKNIALTLFILVGFYGTYKKEVLPKLDFLNIIILLIPIIILIGSYYSIDAKTSIKGLNTIITMSILFVYVRELEWSKEKVEKFLLAIFLGYIITLAWGYYDFIFEGKEFLQLNSVGFVNHSSIYMLLVFIISMVYSSIEYKTLTSKQISFIVFICIISLISVFVTGSRATMYTSIGIICLFGIYVGIKLNKTILIFLALLSIIVVLLFLFNIDQRMVSKFKEGVFDNQPRVDLVIAFFRSWLHHNIFFGIGLNNSYLIHLKEYYPSSIFQSMSHAHDTYLTYLVERGLIGLLLYIIFTFYLLMVLIKKLMQNNRNSLVIISILVWVANFVISFANTTFHHENAIFMLTIWAVTIGSSKNEKIILHKSQ